jgi:catechol-2,3-dioxygenase
MDHTAFDRTAEDVGNIVKLEHVNLTIPDQRLATIFYISALGLTRDPYIMTGVENMWVNVGESQFHLPTNAPQVFRGCIGLVVPDLHALLARLRRVSGLLEGTRFSYVDHGDHVDTTCPWGNRIRCHAPDAARFGARTLGMPYVEFDVAPGTADAIAEFYREILDAPATAGEGSAVVSVGARQSLRFRETDAPLAPYDGHHMQIYLADFSGPYQRLLARKLVSRETDQHEYRFIDIVDLRDNSVKHKIEHEVRSMRHPLFGRPLVNRNPAQSNQGYMPGQDAFR